MAFLTTLALSLIFVTAAAANEESVVTIPLDQIWALDMPGTRDIGEYDFSHDDPRIKGRDRLTEGRGITERLRSQLWLKPPRHNALPALLLRQSPRTNLLQILRVAGPAINKKETIVRARFEQLSERFQTPRNGFRFSLFFYSHPSTYHVELVKVERRGFEINIQYRFVPGYSTESSVHWALIPLGELPAGDYRVNITKLPMAQNFLDSGFEPVSEERKNRIVCQSHDFHVRYMPEKKEDLLNKEAAGEDAVVIPVYKIWALDMSGTRDLDELIPAREKSVLARRRYLTNLREALAPKQPVEKAATGFAMAVNPRRIRPIEMITIREVLRFSRRSNSVPVTEEVGVVFYSNASAYRVELEKVQSRGSVIDIRYRLAPYQVVDPSKKTSVDLAVIPLGKLPAGEYRVEMTRSPMDQKYLDAGHKPVSDEQAGRFICQSFTFEVWNPPKPDPGLSEGAIEIPLDQIWMMNVPGIRNIGQNLNLKQLPQPFTLLSTGSLESLWRLDKNRAETGFVVPGVGQKALVAAHKKLPEGEKPTNVLPVGTEFSAVYFSNGYAASIGLHRVERRGNTIDIRYRFYLLGSGAGSSDMALIPLGKLPVGEYRVNMIETASESNQGLSAYYLAEAHLRVCQSFSFSIVDAIEEKSE